MGTMFLFCILEGQGNTGVGLEFLGEMTLFEHEPYTPGNKAICLIIEGDADVLT